MVSKKLKYSPDFKKEVCEYAKKENIISASVIYSVHRNTVQNWMKKYKKSGVKGFIVKRNDTQETKLDEKTLYKIARFKRKNPGATLGEIKIKFRLDCHETLISTKLSRIYKPQKEKKKQDILFLQTKIIRHPAEVEKEHPVFRLSLHMCGGKPVSVGFTSWYSSEKICLFIRYSLEKLKSVRGRRNFHRIVTNAKFIKPEDFKVIVGDYFDVELESLSAGINTVCPGYDIGFSRKNIRYPVADSYERILESYRPGELNNILLASLVNIDELSKDELFRSGWSAMFMPAETKRSLYAVLERIRLKGNRAALEFDYTTAKSEYNKAYSAMTVLKIREEVLYLSVLSAKAKLYYTTEKYQTALMLFRDISRFSKENGLKGELADCYYYIAMIHRSFQNMPGAVKYFRLSSRLVEKNGDDLSRFMYNRAVYFYYYSLNKFEEAEKYSGLFYEYALKTGYKDLIGNCLSSRGAYLYSTGRYEEFEKMLFEAKRYNLANGNLYEASKNLTNLLSIYSYYIFKDENEINELLDELKAVTDKLNLPHLLYESMYRAGIFYYNRQRNEEALSLLKRSLPGVKRYLTKEAYLYTKCYIGIVLFKMKYSSCATKYLIPVMKESIKFRNDLYLLRVIKYLSTVYSEKGDIKRAVTLILKGIKISLRLNNIYAAGTYHRLYAEICESKNMNGIAKYHYSQAFEMYDLYGKNNDYDVTEEIKYVKSKIQCSK
ncbi:MAG TPA: hypothetical protein PKW56_06335 [Clostridiales bacterium]|nr:hypothetical protein [Clostridiales bacterium]